VVYVIRRRRSEEHAVSIYKTDGIVSNLKLKALGPEYFSAISNRNTTTP